MDDKRPIIGITMGDAAGIGPEIIAKALLGNQLLELCRPVVIGNLSAIENGVKIAGGHTPVKKLGEIQELSGIGEAIELIHLENLSLQAVAPGQLSAACGRAAVEYVEEASRLSMANQIHALVTCPINKEAVHLAGFHGDIGHQEILARLTQSTLTGTMLMTEGLRVAHLSTHKTLIEACNYVRKENIVAKLELTHECLSSWGIGQPSIAVAALNPHGGDGGLIGREEIDEIAPAVKEACSRGMDVAGPFPGDSVFYRAIEGEFDSVLAMYHDQGHIAIKVHNFEDSVTVTMGIPFIRTSVDHGTAFDIAGKGVANPRSLIRAIETAVKLKTRSLAQASV